jgi:hypothetical protein
MFCPQCGLESSSGLQYCRSCGANLKVIGKAVSLSEAIARTDRGLLPKIKEMMKNLKMDQVTEEISRALDQMNQEIVKSSGSLATVKPRNIEKHLEKRIEDRWRRQRKERTAQQRRERLLVRGLVSLFGGAGLMMFLYFLSTALVLKLPENMVAQAPFDIPPVVHMIWLVGLIPMLTGLGRILAGLTIRPEAKALVIDTAAPPIETSITSTPTNELIPRYEPPASVTERTTNILNRDQ